MNGMMRWFRWVGVVLLLPLSVASAQPNVPLPPLAGQIAYISPDRNIYGFHSGQNQHIQITTDAAIMADSAVIYELPTWASDGRLAYFRVRLTRDRGTSVSVFVSADGVTPGDSRYSVDGKTLTYAYWSPQNCDAGERCRDLAVLMGTPGGFDVDLVRDGVEEPTVTTIGSGAPFYYSWSPDGARMLWHRNQSRLELYDVGQGEVAETLPGLPNGFAAPAWSPVDDRLLFVSQSGDTLELAISASGGIDAVVSGLGGPVYFAWSPDGNQIAYVERQGALVVIDAVTGEVVTRSSVNGVLSFFWSPDSRRIAYITLATAPGSFNAFDVKELLGKLRQGRANGLMWSVMDVPSGETRRYGSFIPTREMLYLLSFYDQFAQSHRVWSPDSRYIVYSEIAPDERPVISLLDATQAVGVPLNFADGLFAVWSF